MPSRRRLPVGVRSHSVRQFVPWLPAAGLVALVSCGDSPDLTTAPPPSTIGVLEGQVRIAGQPVAIVVGARTLESTRRIVAQTRSNANGWYRLALPPATYSIEVDASGEGFRGDDRDVVQVETGVQRRDVLRGRLSVHIAVSQAMNGQQLSCELHTGHFSYDAARATAQDGHLDFEFPVLV